MRPPVSTSTFNFCPEEPVVFALRALPPVPLLAAPGAPRMNPETSRERSPPHAAPIETAAAEVLDDPTTAPAGRTTFLLIEEVHSAAVKRLCRVTGELLAAMVLVMSEDFPRNRQNEINPLGDAARFRSSAPLMEKGAAAALPNSTLIMEAEVGPEEGIAISDMPQCCYRLR
jgi:hypothetical protein